MSIVQEMLGFLGVESVRNKDVFGITSVYWKDNESIDSRRNHGEYKKAKKTRPRNLVREIFFTHCESRKGLWQNLI